MKRSKNTPKDRRSEKKLMSLSNKIKRLSEGVRMAGATVEELNEVVKRIHEYGMQKN